MDNASTPYILEVSWGCPSEKYPIHGVFQFDQAKALHEAGERVVFLALDLRSIRRWRKWGVNRRSLSDIPVYEYNFPCGPMPPAVKYRIQDHAFKRAIRAIEKEFGKPRLIHIHTCQQAISATEYCRCSDIPYFITEHITPLDETAPIESRKRDALHGAACVICVSNALGRDIKRTYDVDFTVVPNIVDLSDFRYTGPETASTSSTSQGSSHITHIISAGRVDRGKGFDILIRAYAELKKTDPDVHLTIMGDGPEMDMIRSLATQLGIPEDHTTGESDSTSADVRGSVTFTGIYHRNEFAEALKHSDIFVLPSRSETFGIVYAEAMAAGVPVIGTRCGGPEDFVEDSDGILVPVDDVKALADAMAVMIEEYDNYDSASIAESVRERFAPAAIASRLLQIFYQR
ncbi:MAG: glycosyltransferase [Lachnospiraceae bacterium]|nr:glycosyltransferase [Lachnospiraceae bacterium]